MKTIVLTNKLREQDGLNFAITTFQKLLKFQKFIQ